MRLLFVMTLLVILATVPVFATPMNFKLVTDGGKPVDWGQNSISYLYHTQTGSSFTADVPEGSTLLLGMYLLVNKGGKVTSPSPDVTIAGNTITVDASAIDHSFRSAGAIATLDSWIYVAESLSNDGTNRYVWVLGRGGKVLDRIVTDTHPHALAVNAKTLYVAGDHEIDVFDRVSRHKTGTIVVPYATDISQMAVIGTTLYVGDRRAAVVHVLGSDGTEIDTISGEPTDPLKVTTGLSGIGVAATAGGFTLFITDSNGIREYDRIKKTLRTVVAVHNGCSLAVGGKDEIAIAIATAADRDYGYTPEVWVYSIDTSPPFAPELRMVRVYMSGPRPVPGVKLGYFCGLLGKLGGPGGVAFDEDGRLLVSDCNSSPRNPDSYFDVYNLMPSDGGIIRVTPDGMVDARYGSRFSDPSSSAAQTKEVRARLPLAHTREILAKGGKLNILAWGDSITQTGKDWNGGASSTDKNWVHVLAGLIQQKYPNVTVSAESNGVGGQNVAEGLTRDPTPRWSVQPDLILLEFGTNDAAFHHYAPATYAHYLREMIGELQSLSNSDIVLVSPGPLIGQTVEAPQAEYMKALKAVGAEMDVPVVDIEAEMDAKLAGGVPFETYHVGPTNVHPNDAGHIVWAQTVLDAIAPQESKQLNAPAELRN